MEPRKQSEFERSLRHLYSKTPHVALYVLASPEHTDPELGWKRVRQFMDAAPVVSCRVLGHDDQASALSLCNKTLTASQARLVTFMSPLVGVEGADSHDVQASSVRQLTHTELPEAISKDRNELGAWHWVVLCLDIVPHLAPHTENTPRPVLYKTEDAYGELLRCIRDASCGRLDTRWERPGVDVSIDVMIVDSRSGQTTANSTPSVASVVKLEPGVRLHRARFEGILKALGRLSTTRRSSRMAFAINIFNVFSWT